MGDSRRASPYKVPDLITAKEKKYNYYIRYNSSSIVAKGDYLTELMNMVNRVPFDDRGNVKAKPEDVSMLLIRDYLAEMKSSLAREMEQRNGLPYYLCGIEEERLAGFYHWRLMMSIPTSSSVFPATQSSSVRN